MEVKILSIALNICANPYDFLVNSSKSGLETLMGLGMGAEQIKWHRFARHLRKKSDWGRLDAQIIWMRVKQEDSACF